MNSETVSIHTPVAAPPEITLIPNNSLLTETPEEGRHLAVKMARLIIKMTQPDEAKRLQLRDVYGNDAMMLIAVGQTVATEFSTIAAANNYWRK
ncbi:hexameric tyrosine-coordinated heme protein [Microcoleus sp. bin38.metabat.b11b12b14.051]|uniref:hexameric tyrosine-coordinated heme protein n=1 Tax=Microcoleus sp. bin38.metabat.b11b12b14.051 TaxID=2742709 RepID=UPI0025E1DD94|nr:hexameric tyrosine-coordinated heme protein [Microcoleus sp. bin38.metabat.b11b12b14.051]